MSKNQEGNNGEKGNLSLVSCEAKTTDEISSSSSQNNGKESTFDFFSHSGEWVGIELKLGLQENKWKLCQAISI